DHALERRTHRDLRPRPVTKSVATAAEETQSTRIVGLKNLPARVALSTHEAPVGVAHVDRDAVPAFQPGTFSSPKNPFSTAQMAAWVRFWTQILRNMVLRWTLTVASVIEHARAIILLD